VGDQNMKLRKLIKDEKGYTNLVPAVLAVVIVFALLFVGGYVNGVIHVELEDASDSSTTPGAQTIARMNNASWNFDSTLDIVQVMIIITILAMAIGAIFMFTRFGG